MWFRAKTVDDVVSAFSNTIYSLREIAEEMKEKIKAENETTAKATQNIKTFGNEGIRAERMAKKLSEFIAV